MAGNGKHKKLELINTVNSKALLCWISHIPSSFLPTLFLACLVERSLIKFSFGTFRPFNEGFGTATTINSTVLHVTCYSQTPAVRTLLEFLWNLWNDSFFGFSQCYVLCNTKSRLLLTRYHAWVSREARKKPSVLWHPDLMSRETGRCSRARERGQLIRGDCILRPSLFHVDRMQRTKGKSYVILIKSTQPSPDFFCLSEKVCVPQGNNVHCLVCGN